MRFLADENIEAPVVRALRGAGHEVTWIAEGLRGLSDGEVLSRCIAETRMLLTNDKDFGEMAFRLHSVATGIVLLRLAALPGREKAGRILQVLPLVEQALPGHFAVVTEDRVRLRRLQA